MSTTTIRLPRLHPGQQKIEASKAKRKVVACGRRWGKTKYLTSRMARVALDGRLFGYFGAEYKYTLEVWEELERRLAPVIQSKNQNTGRMKLVTGGLIEFWTLNVDDPGRSRRYHELAVDEAGMVPNLGALWNDAISPTLLDFDGDAIFAGTPKGRNFFHTIFEKGKDPLQPDWESFQAPTEANPHMRPDVIAAYRAEMPERTARQEIDAEFLEDAGGVFPGFLSRVAERRTSLPDAKGPFCFGLDLAKTIDFTVFTGLDSAGRQCEFDRWQRLPWEKTVERVVAHMGRYPGAILTVDSSGVGDPIFEALKRALPHNRVEGYKFTHESKERLVENLQMLIERDALEFFDIAEQTAEMQSYEYRLSKTGGVITTSAPEGMHDDIPTGMMLAAWPFRPVAAKRKLVVA